MCAVRCGYVVHTYATRCSLVIRLWMKRYALWRETTNNVFVCRVCDRNICHFGFIFVIHAVAVCVLRVFVVSSNVFLYFFFFFRLLAVLLLLCVWFVSSASCPINERTNVPCNDARETRIWTGHFCCLSIVGYQWTWSFLFLINVIPNLYFRPKNDTTIYAAFLHRVQIFGGHFKKTRCVLLVMCMYFV